MESILLVSGTALIGYAVGYWWKTGNPKNTKHDGLVAVAYPLLGGVLLGSGIVLLITK